MRASPSLKRRLLHAPGGFARADASADGATIVTTTGSRTPLSPDARAHVWDGRTGAPRFTLKGAQQVRCAAVSPDGSLIATGGDDGDVILWDGRDGHRIRTLTRYADRVLDVAFSPRGDVVASVSRAPEGRLLATVGGAPTILNGSQASLESVNLSADGALALTTGADQTARLWDASTGQELDTFPALDIAPQGIGDEPAQGFGRGAAVFGPLRTIVTTAPGPPAIRVYACDVCASISTLVVLARRRVTRHLTRAERKRYLHET